MDKNMIGVCGPLCRSLGPRPTDEDLALINSHFVLEPLTADELYVRPFYVTSNTLFEYGGETIRWSSQALRDIAKTIVGKSLMKDHAHWSVETSSGSVFAAEIHTESLAEARQRTGEDLHLPEGETEVEWVVARVYIPLTIDELKKLTEKIDTGVFKFVSLTAAYSARVPVRSQENDDKILHYELASPAQAQEVSLVWLGAVPGAAIVSPKDTVSFAVKPLSFNFAHKLSSETSQEKSKMKTLLAALGLSPDASEESALEALTKAQAQAGSKDKIIAALGDVTTEEAVTALKAEAAAGKAFRQSLVDSQVVLEVKLGRHGEGAEDAVLKTRKTQLASRSIDELKSEVTFLETQLTGKHPSKAQLDGGGGSKPAQNGDDGETLHSAALKLATEKNISYTAAVSLAGRKNPELLRNSLVTATVKGGVN